jgi:hypothetical protein
MARRQRAFIAAAGYAVASAEYRTTRQHATYTEDWPTFKPQLAISSDTATSTASTLTESPSGANPLAGISHR